MRFVEQVVDRTIDDRVIEYAIMLAVAEIGADRLETLDTIDDYSERISELEDLYLSAFCQDDKVLFADTAAELLGVRPVGVFAYIVDNMTDITWGECVGAHGFEPQNESEVA